MTNPVRDWPETSYYDIGTLSETVIAFRPNSILEVGVGIEPQIRK
jgi:hypothetical protein